MEALKFVILFVVVAAVSGYPSQTSQQPQIISPIANQQAPATLQAQNLPDSVIQVPLNSDEAPVTNHYPYQSTGLAPVNNNYHTPSYTSGQSISWAFIIFKYKLATTWESNEYLTQKIIIYFFLFLTGNQYGNRDVYNRDSSGWSYPYIGVSAGMDYLFSAYIGPVVWCFIGILATFGLCVGVSRVVMGTDLLGGFFQRSKDVVSAARALRSMDLDNITNMVYQALDTYGKFAAKAARDQVTEDVKG